MDQDQIVYHIYCNWSNPIITNIPDAPARTCTSHLPNGYIYLVGNQISTGTDQEYRSVLTLSLSKNGYNFDKIYAVRYNPPPVMFPGNGKQPEFAYPAAMWIDNNNDQDLFYLVYDVNKESIVLSVVDIQDIKI